MKLQFQVLYREFLFRVVDLELLSGQGDVRKLLGQFAALLLFVGLIFGLGAMGLGNSRMSRTEVLISAWGFEHTMIATTLLVVGLFAVLAWDSTFPDKRDVMVLGPLPVRGITLFAAKATAIATALGFAVVSVNLAVGVLMPVALTPAGSNLLDMLLTRDLYRTFIAYWITMVSAGTFLFCCVLGVQGLAAQLLPRRRFLRFSAALQMAALILFVLVYFLEPSLSNPRALAAPENQRMLAWLPSYWFLGLFQQLNGSMHPAMTGLAWRAWIGLALAVAGTVVAYGLSYFRTLRKIVEAPDIAPGFRSTGWLPRFGNSFVTAAAQFSLRTLLRSRQHRLILAFYLGIGLAIVILFRTVVVRQQQEFHRSLSALENVQLIMSTVTMMWAVIVGLRVVFSLPLQLPANWIFRIAPDAGGRDCLLASRRLLFTLGVLPVWLGSGVVLLRMWPWEMVALHLAVLGLFGVIMSELCLYGFWKIPFTCSHLPGKTQIHMAVLAFMGLMLLVTRGAEFEQRAFTDRRTYLMILGIFGLAAAIARWRTSAGAKSRAAVVLFEETEAPAIQGLGLHRDGVWAIEAPAERD